MQFIVLLMFAGILKFLFGLAMYLAHGEKSKNKPYGSWSNVLGPQFMGSALDAGENLEKEMGKGRHQMRMRRRPRNSIKKKR